MHAPNEIFVIYIYSYFPSNTPLHTEKDWTITGQWLDITRAFLMTIYRQIANMIRTKPKNLNVSRFALQLSLPNPLTPGVKSRMKM